MPQHSQPQNMQTRAMQVRGAATFDAQSNSVKAVVATENPVVVYDWSRAAYIEEVLLVSGVILPDSGTVPMLDTHDRWSVDKVLGSGREFGAEQGAGAMELVGTLYFGQTKAGEAASALVRDAHLTDVSAGYEVIASTWIEAGESVAIEGKSFAGPMRVVTQWRLLEISLAPIGADPASKTRARRNPKPEGKPMPQDPTNPAERAKGSPAPAADPTPTPTPTPAAEPQPGARSVPEPAAPSPAPAPQPQARALTPDECAEIMTRATSAGCPDIAADCIRRGLTPDQASTEILMRMRQDNPPLARGRIEPGTTEREKFTRAASDGLCMRMGSVVDKPAPGAREFRGRSLLRLAEECLSRAGLDTRSMSDREIAELALGIRSHAVRSFGMVTSDFPAIMGAGINSRLLQGFGSFKATWNVWMKKGDVSDFKDVESIRLSDAPMPKLVNERGQYQAAVFGESKETYRVHKYGNIFHMTFEMIRNDSLRAFADLLYSFGQSSSRLVNEVAYAPLVNNVAMSDGKTLFHADHLNIETDAAAIGPVSRAGLAAARAGLMLQKSPQGQELGLEAAFLLVPAAQMDALDVLLRSPATIEIQDGNGQVIMNPTNNRNQVPVVEPILDRLGGKAWFAATDYGQEPTIEVGFLDGQETPDVVEIDDPQVDGLSYRLRMIVGSGPMSARGMRMNPGA